MKKFIILIITIFFGLSVNSACKLEKIITGAACSTNQNLTKNKELRKKNIFQKKKLKKDKTPKYVKPNL